MKRCKKWCLAVGLLTVFFCGISNLNMASAVSEASIKVHDKVGELANAMAEYYFEEYISGAPEFVKKLNKDQIKLLKASFKNSCFPELVQENDKISLVASVKSVDLLNDAVAAGDVDLVKLIVENFHIENINETNINGNGSALWRAVYLADGYSKNVEKAKKIIDYLLYVGADPYTQEGKGYIPVLFEGNVPESRLCLKKIFEKHYYFF